MLNATGSSAAACRLMLADDHPLVLDGLHSLFERMPWIGEIHLARDGLELCESPWVAQADAAIIDLSMPRLDGLSSIRRLRRRYPDLAIVAITGAEHWFPESEVRDAGADMFLSKHRPGEEIVAALVRALARHEQAVGDRCVASPHRASAANASAEDLSEREREVLKLLAEGYGVDETAELLCISPATVRKHREHLFAKLGTSNVARLTLIAVRRGLVQG